MAFAKAGVSSLLVGRSLPELEAVAHEVMLLGAKAQVVELDLSEVSRIRGGLAPVLKSVGSVDFLVNNAGMGLTANVIDTALEDWQRVMDLNLSAPFQCIQAVLPLMRSRQQGTIINVISVAGSSGFSPVGRLLRQQVWSDGPDQGFSAGGADLRDSGSGALPRRC